MVEQIKDTLTYISAKFKSRRYFSMWILTLIVTGLFLLPPTAAFVISVLSSSTLSFVLLDQVTYAGLLGWIWATYLTSDYKTKTLGQYINEYKNELEKSSREEPTPAEL